MDAHHHTAWSQQSSKRLKKSNRTIGKFIGFQLYFAAETKIGQHIRSLFLLALSCCHDFCVYFVLSRVMIDSKYFCINSHCPEYPMTRIYVEFVKPNKPLIRMTTMVDIADCRFVVVWWILVDLKMILYRQHWWNSSVLKTPYVLLKFWPSTSNRYS